jgi:uncharacterized protein
MAKLDREAAPSGPIVRGFSGTGFKVGEDVYEAGLLLTPEWARPWQAPRLDQLDATQLADLLSMDLAPEFLLLGTGATMRRPPVEFVAAFEGRGIGVEAMDSRAAARAWAVLRSEDRWIVAALLPLA